MNKKKLLTSLMSIAMLVSISTGATYALFTAEDEVNVNVSAGKVSVSANVAKTFYVKSLDTELTEVTETGKFSTGGTATVDANGNITLDKIVPGDKVVFNVEIKNDSNVDVNYQSVISVTEGIELFSGLVVTVDDLSDSEEATTYNGLTAYSKWEYLTPGTGNRTVQVTVELPETAGNEYQGLTTNISYFVNAVQGNAPVVEAEYDEKTTYVYTESDLRLVALSTNKGNNFSGKTVKLMADIDLNNSEWTPIGTSTNAFSGTFDGQNHTISNLNVGESKTSNIGLFGHTTNGLIKNVHVHNADVDGRLNVGVVAGSPYTSKYQNITVTGKVTVDGMSYVGGVFGKNAYANLTNITVDVTDDSYVYANSIENGTAYRTYVGGVVGFMGEGTHTVSYVTSNIDVLGTTCDVGGIAGIVHYGNKFVNCVSTGDVTITSYIDDGDQLEIGGIGGVWMNSTGTVTLDNCTYNGTLKAVHENGTVYTGAFENNGLVGKGYYASGAGQLIIPGYTGANEITDIRDAFANGENVELEQDVTGDSAKGGYSVAGFVQNGGQTIDGNGNTLTVNNANDNYGCVIYTNGGTIRNIKVRGAFRGIFTAGLNTDLYLDNVDIDDVCYTFNSDGANANYGLYFTNSTFNGWTSYTGGYKEVKITDCKFGKGTGGYQYAFCRPYSATTFTNCVFEEGYEFDASRTTNTFVNCYVGNVRITSSNVTELLGANAAKAIVR